MLRPKGLAGKSFRILKDLRASPFSSLKDLLRVLKDLLASPFRSLVVVVVVVVVFFFFLFIK